MSKMITGSICLTDIGELVKANHSAISTGKNGKKYCSLLVWENDEQDKFGNDFCVQLNAAKDAPDSEKKQYVGNLKYVEKKVPSDAPGGPAQEMPDTSGLPF